MTQPWSNNSQFALLIINANTGTLSGLFVFDASGKLIDSIAAAAGTINGQPFKKGIATYRPSDGLTVNLDAGQVLFSDNATTTAGFLIDTGDGSMELSSSLATGIHPGDVLASLILQSKANSQDGLNPELLINQRVQILNQATGGPAYASTSDPNNAGALESFHNFSNLGYVNGWTNSATGATPGYMLAVQHPGFVIMGGRVNVGGAPVAGQAITNAATAPYQPASVQSITGWDLTGANANKPVRLFWTAGGVLTFGGPIASIAANDDIDIPFQLVSLTR